jgi:hypothetical protein
MVILAFLAVWGLIIALSLWVKKKERDLDDPFVRSQDARVSSHTSNPVFLAAVQDRMNGGGPG